MPNQDGSVPPPLGLIVLLTTYNEKDNIAPLVNQILEIPGSRIVVVDDTSPDGTGDIVLALARANSGRIHLIQRTERGAGTANIAGFRYALTQEFDCLVRMDTDFSHHPRYIPQFVAALGQYDVVIGSRFVRGGRAVRTPLRKVISNGANLFSQLMLGWSIRDWCGGYRGYTRAALASLNFDEFYSTGYSIGMETLYRLKKKGFRYVEIPIEFVDVRKKGSKFAYREIFRYAMVVIRLRLSL
jgi:dolichol-phosphate mannosyltransferase